MEGKPLVGMPPEWSDDQKMTVLFSPFRQSRQVNPDGWDGKLRFWTQCIMKRCLETGTAVIVPSELPRIFQRNGRLPFCLGTVVETMIRNGQLRELSDVLLRAEQSWLSWSYDLLVRRPTQTMFNVFVKKPTMWTFSKLFSNEKRSTEMSTYTGTITNSSALSDKQFVVVDVVQHLGEKIQKTFYGSMTNPNKDRLVSMTTLRQMCQKCCPCDISFKLALSWLCREKKCLIIDVEGQGKVVVFADLSKRTCQPPTDTEVTVYKLNCTTDELQKQIETLQRQMDSLHVEAKLYLKKGMKGSAKNCLRRRKRLELQQSKKEAAIENIHQLLCTIQQTETDKQVLDVYSSSVAAYKDLTKKHGLTTEAVDDVMLGIQEVLDTQEEMDHSISTSVLPGDLTCDDLEQELNDILADENISAKLPQPEPHQDLINALCQMKVVEGEPLTDQLPDVPVGIPSVLDDLPPVPDDPSAVPDDLPAVPDDPSAVPDDLPAVPHDLPSIPGDLPVVPDSFRAVPAVPSKMPHDQSSYISEHAFST